MYFVSMKIAELLKAAGYDRASYGVYVNGEYAKGLIKTDETYDVYSVNCWNLVKPTDGKFQFVMYNKTISGSCSFLEDYDLLSAPTLDEVRQWLHDEKNIDVWVAPESMFNSKTEKYEKKYVGYVLMGDVERITEETNEIVAVNDDYEDALEHAIKRTLQRILFRKDK